MALRTGVRRPTPSRSPAIKELTSAVFDNGRRGLPRPGCDCEQCFGYCMIDGDAAQREMRLRAEAVAVAREPRYDLPLDLPRETV